MKNEAVFLSRRILLATAALAFSAPALSLEQLETTTLNDGSFIAFGYNDSVKQSNGRIHIAVQGTPSDDPENQSSRDIYYMLVSGSGKVLIDATKVSGATAQWGRPHIALTSEHKAVITWNGNGDGRIHYVYVDPSGDDRDGDAADPDDILEVVDTVVGVNTGNGHNALVVDRDDVAHVFKNTGSGLFYFSFEPNDGAGAPDIITTEVELAGGDSGGRSADPAVALDSDGNLHVLFRDNDPVSNLDPVAYMMVNGATGAKLIDATPLYDATATLQLSAHFSIAVDSGDNVHAVYGDKRFTIDANTHCDVCETGGHMFYTRLDPSNDAQDGTASTIATLREGAETVIWGYWYSKAFYSGGKIDVFGTTGGESSDSRTMAYVRIDPNSGGASVGTPKVFTTGVLTPGWSKHFVSRAGGKIIWTAGGYSIPLAQPSYPLVMAPISRFSGGGGGSGAVGPLALLVLLLGVGMRRLARVAALAALLVAGGANAEALESIVLNDGAAVGFGPPDAAVDATGNIHIVATGSANPAPHSSDSGRDIYYMMIEPDGDVRIDATKVTTVSGRYSKPQVVVTATGKVSVTYKSNGSALVARFIDPALDDQNGDAANPATIVGAETTVGPSTSTGHITTVIDPAGTTVYAVWNDDSNLFFVAYTAATGAVVTSERSISDKTGRRGVTPALGMDSDGNLHVLYQTDDDDGFDLDPVAYMMFSPKGTDGIAGNSDDGTVLIDRALLIDEFGVPQHGAHLSLAVDSSDRVHLIYGDKRYTVDRNSWCDRCESGGDMFYTRIDPSRHPQNGGRGSIEAMRQGSEVHLGGHWYSQAFRASNGRFHMYSTTGYQDSQSENMIYRSFTPTSGGADVGRVKLGDTGVLSAHYSKHYVTSVADRVIWVAGGYNVPLAQPVFPLVMAGTSDFSALKSFGPSSGSTGGRAGGAMPLSVLLALGFVGAALWRRRH